MQRKKIVIDSRGGGGGRGTDGGIAVARAQGGSDLPSLTPAELLAKVAESAPKTTTVSGDVAWTNDLLGPMGHVARPGGRSRRLLPAAERIGQDVA